jgi:type IX secretion system PorP/SprF family membrane protein
MKKSIQCFLFLLPLTFAIGQQRAQYTQYILNNYLLNPAAGGVNEYWDVKMGLRNQWTGFEGAPFTYFASANGPIGFPHKRVRKNQMKPHHGVGGYVFHDETGPLSMTGLYGSYSYHLKASEKLTISMGANVGLMQYRVQGNQLVFVQNPDDPSVTRNTMQYSTPDASLGLWFYNERFYGGISANQLFKQNLKFSATNDDFGKLNYHYFITGGYRFSLNQSLDLIPSTMIKFVYNSPLQMDFNARLKYNNMAWVGFSYRRQDAMAILLGVLLNSRYEIGYSYDLTTSKLRNSSWGSHEIIVGVNLIRANKVLCPNDFWN